jgi:hypothetical protein
MIPEKWIEQLSQSPLFQLSLSSKELFHSNFLAWLFTNYKQESSKVLRVFIDDNNNNYTISNVKREEKNRDLTVYFQDKNGSAKKLIIENKVKSIPNYQQLVNYSKDGTKEEYYILLSLAKPFFFNRQSNIYKRKQCSMDIFKLWEFS